MLIDALTRLFGGNVPVFALLFIGFSVEKYYVSRVTVFSNTIALNVSFLSIERAPRLLVWYGDLGLLLGIYGMTAYLLNVKTWWGYNAPAFLLYASLPVAAVVLASPGDWWLALITGGLANFILMVVLQEETGIDIMHWGPRHGQVNRFIQKARMKYIDPHGVHRTVDLALGEFDE